MLGITAATITGRRTDGRRSDAEQTRKHKAPPCQGKPIEPKFCAPVLISAWCGLRFGEPIELRRKDFNADCSIVKVARGVIHRTKSVRTAENNERCVVQHPEVWQRSQCCCPAAYSGRNRSTSRTVRRHRSRITVVCSGARRLP